MVRPVGMGLLDRFLDVPAWADALTLREYARFDGLLSSALRARSLPSKVRPGGVRVRVGGVDGSLAFRTLARKCKLAAEASWESVIAEHLDIALSDDNQELTKRLDDYDQAKKLLKIQLLSDSFVIPRWESGVNYRLVAPGIAAVLAIDLPETVTSVEPTRVRTWGRSYDELFEVAAGNIRSDPKILPVSKELLDSGCTIHRLEGDSYFVSAQALWLGQFPESRIETGALVSVPSRHLVQFYSAADGQAVAAMQILAVAGVTLHEQLPCPVSTSLYWMKGEQIVPIPVKKHESGQIEIMPPREVLATLELYA